MILSSLDLIWNRAALHMGGTNPGPGDSALSALLLLHGAAMNGGLSHAVDSLTKSQYASAVTGYRYFGFAEVATLLERSIGATEEELEESDNAYSTLIPSDSTLVDAFEARYALEPEVFAPL